jgi:hypothetical protein
VKKLQEEEDRGEKTLLLKKQLCFLEVAIGMLHLHLMLIFSQMIFLGKGSDLPVSHYFVKKTT